MKASKLHRTKPCRNAASRPRLASSAKSKAAHRPRQRLWRVTLARGKRRRAAFAKNMAKRDAAILQLRQVAAATKLVVWGEYESQNSRLSYLHSSPDCSHHGTVFTATAAKLARGHLACGCNRRAAGERRALPIAAAAALAESRHGHLLSTEYRNNRQLLKWKCADGHRFEMTYSDASRGRWCPRCADSRSNAMCKVLLDCLLGVEFEPEKTPDFLADASAVNGLAVPLRFDGWYEQEKIGFEHQGPQHFVPVVRNSTEAGQPDTATATRMFERGKKNDAIKRKACEGEATLIVIDDISAHGYGFAQAATIIDTVINAARRCLPPDRLDRAFEMAAERLGMIDETGWRELIKPIFAGSRRLRRLEALAKERGGRVVGILDDRRAVFECADGHRWEAQVNNVIAGMWCPVEGVAKRASSRRMTIPALQARLAGIGLCLQWTADEAERLYQNNQTPLPVMRIACGGRFNRPVAKLHAGSRCPGCKGKRVCTGRAPGCRGDKTLH